MYADKACAQCLVIRDLCQAGADHKRTCESKWLVLLIPVNKMSPRNLYAFVLFTWPEHSH